DHGRGQLRDESDRLAPVPGLADDLHVTLELQDVADATPEERVAVHDHDPSLDAFVAPVGAATSLLRLGLALRLALRLWLGLGLRLAHVLLLGLTGARHDRVSASGPGSGAESASPRPVATRSARAIANPRSTAGGRRSVMNPRTSSRPSRSMRRRKAISSCAARGDVSSTRSRYSTWKMALVRTCAGPSWTSSARRWRSPSWA